jgi:3-(3-hydroxy-phenyl)propionate hydroxylase
MLRETTSPGEGAPASYRETAAFNPYSGSGYQLPEYPFIEPADLSASAPILYPVVIVGGGISGLTLACALADMQVHCVLLDEDNTVGVRGASSRGICYAQKSLEIYKRLGIYERIAARGVQWSIGRTFAGHNEIYSFDLRRQQTHRLSAQPPFINIQQFYIEGFLVDRIYELGYAELRWKNRVVGFEQNAQLATLTVDTPAGRYTMQARHVIDATGVHSPFRRWLNVEVDSRRGDDRWCIADVRFGKHPPVERHTWIEAPFNENRAVWQHLMADDVWRLDYQMEPDCDMAAVAREDVVRARLERQFGKDVACEIVWVGPYSYRGECLRRFRHGRVLFIGDAAHVVSPFGARGGNSGLQDADNLAWKLAAVVRGKAPERLLDSYDAERRDAALQNVRVTHRTSRFLRPAGHAAQLLRSAVIGLARQYPFARALVNTGRMSVPNAYTQSPVCDASGGVSVQNAAFEWADGRGAQLTDLLHWTRGRLLLLVFGPLSRGDIARLAALAPLDVLRAVQVVRTRAAAQVRERAIDRHGALQRACGDGRWVLLRPDGYRAAGGARIDAALVRAVQHALGADA